MVRIRLADVNDADELVRMRWDFSREGETDSEASYEEFHRICGDFLEKALDSGDWYIWVAEADGGIAAHMYVQLIHKMPRPGKSPDPYFGYVTNVYTRPVYRNRGIGSELQRAIEQWAKTSGVEFLIVWPSSASVPFYERSGFARSEEAMEKHW